MDRGLSRDVLPWLAESLGGGEVGLGRIGAVLVMHFPAGDRRIEHAGGQYVGFRPHDVAVMVVERVHHAGSQLVDLAGRKILDRAGALEPQYRLRSEERRVGKECVSTCRSRWSPYP